MPFWWNDAGKLAKRSDKNCHLIWAWACKDDRSFCTFRPPTVWHAFLNWFLFVRSNPTEAMCWPFLSLPTDLVQKALRLQQISLCFWDPYFMQAGLQMEFGGPNLQAFHHGRPPPRIEGPPRSWLTQPIHVTSARCDEAAKYVVKVFIFVPGSTNASLNTTSITTGAEVLNDAACSNRSWTKQRHMDTNKLRSCRPPCSLGTVAYAKPLEQGR